MGQEGEGSGGHVEGALRGALQNRVVRTKGWDAGAQVPGAPRGGAAARVEGHEGQGGASGCGGPAASFPAAPTQGACDHPPTTPPAVIREGPPGKHTCSCRSQSMSLFRTEVFLSSDF